ncbi:MAG: hypothetical protein Q9160_006279 [Pyrenula sp. 1 TL-2023]
MSGLSSVSGPGFFYVLSAPKETLSSEEYHDWYNREHGPLRLKLDFIPNGFRYQGRDAAKGIWMACYDLDQVAGLEDPSYTNLRATRSRRETAIVEHGLEYLDRRIYSLYSSRGSATDSSPVILAVTMRVKDSDTEEVDKWYEEEHLELLSKIPGWRRSRRFRLVWSEDIVYGHTELLAVHEFAKQNGIGGPEHQLARDTPWRSKVVDKISYTDRKYFELFHILKADEHQPPKEGSTPEITSWRLDGNTGDPQSPVVAFSNSILTNFHIWDETVAALRVSFPNFRFLRYNTRGYDSNPGMSVDVDMLSADLVSLLDHLNIETCHAVIGVSLGGITTLDFAAHYPNRLKKFVACDCNCKATPSNSKAWDERVSLVKSSDGLHQHADQTIQRWFTASATKAQIPAIARVKSMILSASVDGFVSCTNALKTADLSTKIKSIKIPGMCVVGSQDGALPHTMSDFTKTMSQTTCTQIPDSGHLPMLENPTAFIAELTGFL